MTRSLIQFWRDELGGPLVEAAIVVPIFLIFSLGSVDYLYAFYQWTAATKAVEVGARLSAVSDPVASGLTGVGNIATSATADGTVLLGQAMPDFELTCNDAGSGACTCTRGSCGTFTGYSVSAMNTIVYGRGNAKSCNDATSYYDAGMCDILKQITPGNVKVVYSQTGLGYAGRIAGPVPTITVSLQRLTYQFIFLKGLPGFSDGITMPPFSTTITGEGLSSGVQPPPAS
jgi:Flp pilus assembly protein TadG